MNKSIEEYIIRTERYQHHNHNTYYLLTEYGTLCISIYHEPHATQPKLYTEHLLFPTTPKPFVAEVIQYVRELDSKLINTHA